MDEIMSGDQLDLLGVSPARPSHGLHNRIIGATLKMRAVEGDRRVIVVVLGWKWNWQLFGLNVVVRDLGK